MRRGVTDLIRMAAQHADLLGIVDPDYVFVQADLYEDLRREVVSLAPMPVDEFMPSTLEQYEKLEVQVEIWGLEVHFCRTLNGAVVA